MKKNLIMKKLPLPLIAIEIILLFFTGCDKIITNRYTGDWDFITEHPSYNYVSQEVKWETIYFSGSIGTYKNNDELSIQYTEDRSVVFQVNKKGELFIKDDVTSYTYGKFEGKDKVHIECGDIINGVRKSK